jgi:hypothetical protein
MAKCEEGYLCDVCGQDVAELWESDLYLRYVIGLLDPETLLPRPSDTFAATRSSPNSSCTPILSRSSPKETSPSTNSTPPSSASASNW